MTRIAFLGYRDSFNWHHVGGTDSFVRRMATGLAASGDTVDLVLYSCAEQGQSVVTEGVTQSTFVRLSDACAHLNETAQHVVSIYLRPADRWAYARFRRIASERLTFHHWYTTWSESWMKRSLLFAEARLWPFNGWLFCLSPRLLQQVCRWTFRAKLLLPPVPQEYFCHSDERPNGGTLRIAYAGRLDTAKGADVAIDALRVLARNPRYDVSVYGFAWAHDTEGRALHESLLREPALHYQPVNQRQWTPQTDIELARHLANTDVLFLPYRRLSSTIDIPLLLLEAMASLCAVVTPGLGDLHGLYGDSCLNLPRDWNRDTLVDVVERAGDCLLSERRRLLDQNAYLGFDTGHIAARFRSAMSENG